MFLRTSTVAGASVIALLLALTACGGGSDDSGAEGGTTESGFADQSVSEIQDQVAEDMTNLQSVRMAGDITKDGESIAIDLALNTEGECAGSIKLAGGSADIIVGAGGQFLKGDDALWEAFMGSPQSAKQITEVLGDKWALLPADGEGFASFCDLDGLLEEFDSVDADDGTVSIGEQADIEGTSALELISEDDTPTSIWVATEAPHYIVQIESQGEDAGTINFSDFDVEVGAEAPPEDEVVDLSKL